MGHDKSKCRNLGTKGVYWINHLEKVKNFVGRWQEGGNLRKLSDL